MYEKRFIFLTLVYLVTCEVYVESSLCRSRSWTGANKDAVIDMWWANGIF